MALSDHPMWRKPQHHLDLDDAHDHVHWVELFYDLIHVVTIFLLGNYLSHHISPEGFMVFAGLFIAFWFAWGDSSAFNSLYVSTDIWHRVIMSAQICTVMFMAAAIPAITGKGWVFFALGYAANRAITAFLYWRVIKANSDTTSMPYEMARNFACLAVLFAVSAFIPAPYSYYLFAAGIVIIQLLYMLPVIGVLRFERFVPRLGHMSERFALLLLIVSGEGFFKLVLTLSEKGIYKVSYDVLMNFVIGGVSIFVLCWLYFDLVGNGKPKDTKTPTMVKWWLANLVLMLAAVMMGVALTGEVKVGFWDPFPVKYAWLGCTGLAIYLLCIMVIKSTVEPRVAHRFAKPWIQVAGAILAIITLIFVPYVPAIVGNMLWGAALYMQLLIPLIASARTLAHE